MPDDVTTEGESPSLPADMPAAGRWPEDGPRREMTEYQEPPGERDEPGAREREQKEAPQG